MGFIWQGFGSRATGVVSPASNKGQPLCRIAFAQGSRCMMWKDEEVQCAPQGELVLCENNQLIKLYDVNC